MAPGPNKSPAIKWSKGTAGTASYTVIMVDPDAPTVLDGANKEGRIIPADLKRRDLPLGSGQHSGERDRAACGRRVDWARR
jgi:phosphatidylethanolamine-binding protein (PEBP) family uncharacterized protein